MANLYDDVRWEDEDEFWRAHYHERPYYSTRGGDYDFYQPGYRYGYDAAQANPRGSRSRTRYAMPGIA